MRTFQSGNFISLGSEGIIDKLLFQVHARYTAIVARATELRDRVLEDLGRLTQEIEEDLISDAQRVQQHLDALVQLQQRLYHALDSANDAEVVAVEKEMREGEGSVEELAKVERSLPTTTQRPGLQGDAGGLKDHHLQLFIGSPVKLQMFNVAAVDSVTPIYRCGEDASCREVHAICQVGGNLYIAFGGKAPEYKDEREVTLSLWDNKMIGTEVRKIRGRITYNRFRYFASGVSYVTGGELQLNGISNNSFQLKVFLDRKGAVIRKKDQDFVMMDYSRLLLNGLQTVCAFDANIRGNLFVIIGEGEGSLDSTWTGSDSEGNTDGENTIGKRTVILYRRDHEDPVATYSSPQQKSFTAAVCFWKPDDSGCEFLLVADWLNDSVHVVRVENDQLHFVRYLAAGSSDLVRPTALYVDPNGETVWIGCENGWVLRCEPGPNGQEEEEEDGEWDGQSDSLQLLHVDNESGRTPDTMSQVSDETA